MNDNLISRQDAIDALEEQLDYLRTLNKNENPTAEGKWYGVNWARNTIADLPSAERPQGEWLRRVEIFDDEESPRLVWGCKDCGFSLKSSHDKRNYCPNCGASMKGSDNE